MEGQLRHILSWFKDWSEMQKSDFLKILNKKFSSPCDGLFDAIEMLRVNDRPPTLFQCQMKLFNEWFDLWSESERGAFIEKLREIDATFISQFEDEINGPPHPNQAIEVV
uniref:Uncharacterized protein n=1 Tax=Strigamia maritima TaxID=126957 RepID=T1JLH5_STRMM